MNLLARRLSHGLLILADTGVAALLVLLSTAGRQGLPMIVVPALVCVLPVAVRRIWPLSAYGGALVATVLTPVLETNSLTMSVVVALTIYTVSASRPVRQSATALAAGLLVVCGANLAWLTGIRQVNGWPDPLFVVGTAGLVMAAGWSLGTVARTRREFAAREDTRRAEQALIDERLRIARELHDVVAHTMSAITVKAGVAAKVLDKHPEEGRKALRDIEELGRGSLVEMRRMLGTLRAPGTTPENAPLPGIADLPSLAARAAEAGVRVELSVSGDVPEPMGLSVYRIVQEAITNVVRHAAPARCRVGVSVADGTLSISVVDDGPGRRVLPDETGGHGLTGMRERVMLYGGAFEAGPRPEGGFGVFASWEIS
ncbi:sensor histidine kinase [Sinosporangium siamense]|uniref:histidine kinase n=1 Tax=Sinosporangium siamense TaxID=1367973 RepID=A0A919RB00_9ACTN|nr:sensor histidine kinase [Sinosporangium siamense]GII90383.1 two-component sensor histidine kinase [Sinosporangium siamense]